MIWNKVKVTCAWSVPIILAAGAVPLAVDLAVDDFKPIQVQLGLLSPGAFQAFGGNPRLDRWGFAGNPIVLGPDKPAAFGRVPSGLEAPLYAELTFGPREQPKTFAVLVDEPDGKPARLWVDRNENGDLTDDPLVEWTLKREPNPAGSDFTFYLGQATLLIQSGGQPLEFGLRLHRLAKDHPYFKGSENVLKAAPDYARTGYATLRGKRVRAALSDGRVGGDFRGAPNEPNSDVHLLLDLDGDGRFVYRGERFDVAKPFNIGGTTYEIANMSPLGDTFTIVKSHQKVAEVPILPDFTEGDKVPPFVKAALDGRKLSFPKDYKGKVVLLDFWATWCGPCVEEIPNVRAAYMKFHDQGLEILGISLDFAGQREMLVKFTKSKGMSWPQIYEGKGAEVMSYDLAKFMTKGNTMIPHYLLVDGDTGEILATTWDLRGGNLPWTIQEALKKKAQRKAQ